jgi:hypothetical protein
MNCLKESLSIVAKQGVEASNLIDPVYPRDDRSKNSRAVSLGPRVGSLSPMKEPRSMVTLIGLGSSNLTAPE